MKRAFATLFSIGAALLVVHCGGSTVGGSRGGATGGASTGGGANTGGAGSGGCAGDPGGIDCVDPCTGMMHGPECTAGGWNCNDPDPSQCPDAGIDSGGGCRPAPPSHRAAAATCASNGDAGVAMCGGGTTAAHDACLDDGDCGATGVCVCQQVDTTGPAPCGVPPVVGNVCVPSNCRTDADCPTCGACIPQESICGGVGGYFCQTPQDTCTTNADCTAQPNGQCSYNQSAGAWACRYDMACPG